jgi:hypothetical protein
MTRNKDLKRLVRARMSKTGESYTTSLARVRARRPPKARVSTAAIEPPKPQKFSSPPSAYAELAGTADATIKAKTGCTWERWVAALDALGAAKMSHRDIAALVASKYKFDGWWGQTVTVGYERIKGLRARGQRRDGTFEANKSRTFTVPVADLFEAWADSRVRRRWLDGEVGKVRTRTTNKSIRLDGRDKSIVVVGFIAKGAAKSTVAVQHTKLRDKETATRLKEYWSRRLDALGEVLA